MKRSETGRMSRIAHEALCDAARQLDCEQELESFDVQAGHVVDDMTALLLRAWKVNHS